jgi:3-oxoacyl-[acyl-carrier protein] reductase
MDQLQGKVAIITGGARGIGRSIASRFAEEGARIVIFDKFFPDDFNAYADGLRARGTEVVVEEVDVTSTESVEAACDRVAAQCGSIDILVNNAGITRDKLILRMKDEDWDAVLTVNLKGAFTMSRAVAKKMIRQTGGKIINITSVVGVIGNAGQANYAASKAGMIGLAKSLAKELASRNICVNCIAPGFVETEMTHVLTEEQQAAFLNVIPLRRACRPDEIAAVAVFLASKNSDYITGQVLCVDGGMVM